MGLFYSAPRKSATPSTEPSSHRPDSSSSSHHVDQHGSMHGEINKSELRNGILHDVHEKFHGTERKAISALLSEQMDSSSGNRRHVLDTHEADAIVKDVHHIYSKEHADTLQEILKRRLQ